MAFDPDAYLASKTSTGGFDPDAYLAQKAPAAPQDQSSSPANILSSAVKVSPLGMVASGANAIQSGLGKIGNAFPLPVPQSVQQGARAIFSPFRAAGVTASYLVPRALFGGNVPTSTADIQNAVGRGKAALSPSFQPANSLEKTGAMIGENAPVAAASILSPNIGGPLSMMAQQAQNGQVSPVPLALGLVSKGSGAVGNKVESIGSTMEDTGQKMATGIANVLPNTIRRLANKFSANGNPAEAGAAIGQKLVDDGVLEGNDIGDIFNKVQSKQQEAGQAVSDSLKAIKDESDKYGEIENPLQQPADQVLAPLQDQSNQLAKGRLSGTRAMAAPVNQLLKSFADTAKENNGMISFDDVDQARKEVGDLWAKTPDQSPKFAQYSQLYGTLADIRNTMVDNIAANAHAPELASDLQKANSEFHFYDSVLNDVTKGAAKAGTGGEGLASAISGKMGQLGALYALARGDVKRAMALGLGGKVLPMLEDEISGAASKEMIKTGKFFKNKGTSFQNVPRGTVQTMTLSNPFLQQNQDQPTPLFQKAS